MSWDDFQRQQGAILAPDSIPLQYGDLITEYHAALEHAVLMDRSHEGRLECRGRSRFDLIQRISTNNVVQITEGEGQPTIFTNPTGRILDRIMVYNRGETALITSEPGRGTAVRTYLQKQVFFNDDFRLLDLAGETRLFTLHGPLVSRIINPPQEREGNWRNFSAVVAGYSLMFLERKPLSGEQWAIIVPQEGAQAAWEALMGIGKAYGLLPAGSLTYNVLRIRAGRPAAGRELSTDYIPLEAGLWDEVSFDKGCYTGQEIIARMESRHKLAKTLVKLQLSQMVEAPANLNFEGKNVGTLTSSVTTPDGEILGLGFVKTTLANNGQSLTASESQVQVSIIERASVQAPNEIPAVHQ